MGTRANKARISKKRTGITNIKVAVLIPTALIVFGCGTLLNLNQSIRPILPPTSLPRTVDSSIQAPDSETISTVDKPLILKDISAAGPILADYRQPDGQSSAYALVPQFAHSGVVYSIAYSIDGLFLVSVSSDNCIKIWRSFDGLLVRSIFPGKAVPITAVAISSDNKTVLTGDSEGVIKAWDPATGSKVGETKAHEKEITSISFDNSGSTLATSSADGLLKIWAYPGMQPIAKAMAYEDGVQFAKISPDGKYIVSAGGFWTGISAVKQSDYALRLWRTSDLKPIRKLIGHTDTVKAISISFDSKTILSASEDRHLIVWDAATGSMIKRIAAPESILCIAIHPNGIYAASGSGNKFDRVFGIGRNSKSTVSIWNLQTGSRIRDVTIESQIETVAFSPRGDSVSFGEDSGIIQSIKLDSGAVSSFGNNPGNPEGICFVSNSGKFAYSIAGCVYIRSISGNLIARMTGDAEILCFRLDPQGKRLIAGHEDGFTIWDLSGQKKPVRVKTKGFYCADIAISPDGTSFATGSGKKVRLWSFDGKLLREYSESKEDISCVAMSPDGTRIAASSMGQKIHGIVSDANIRIWDLGTGGLLWASSYTDSFITSIAFSPKGDTLAAVSGSGSLVMLALKDLQRHKEVESLKGRFYENVCFSPDGSRVALPCAESVIELKDQRDFSAPSTDLLGHTARVGYAQFSPDGKYILSLSDDSTIKLWGAKGTEILTFIAAKDPNDDWIIYSPDGYFDGSKNGGKLLGLATGFSVYGIDQYALIHNRPDRILSSLDNGDETESHLYLAQYQRRMDRIGMTGVNPSAMDDVPVSTINSLEKTAGSARLSFTISSTKSPLRSYALYVNDVPIYEGVGKQVSPQNSMNLEETIPLSAGWNKIEVSCVNAAGNESLREQVRVEFQSNPSRRLFFLGFGISKYQGTGIDLKYAAKDASDLAKAFSAMKGSYYEDVLSKVLLDERVTKETVSELKSFFREASVDDTVVLFVAGHGAYGGTDDPRYYYLAYDTDLRDIASRSIDFESLESMLSGIRARNKLFLLDTCASGELYDDMQMGSIAVAQSRGIIPRYATQVNRGLSVVARPSSGDKPIINRDRFVFNDLLRRTGAIVFSSCRGNEFSYESDEIRNGYVTHALIQAFTKPTGGGKQALLSFRSIQDDVTRTVSAATENLQNPTVDRDNIFQTIYLPSISMSDPQE